MNRHKLLIALCLLASVCQAQNTDQPTRVSTTKNTTGIQPVISEKNQDQLQAILAVELSQVPQDFPRKTKEKNAEEYKKEVAEYAAINPSLFTAAYLSEIGYKMEKPIALPQYHTHANVNSESVAQKLTDGNVKITFGVKPFGINQTELLSIVSNMDGVKEAEVLGEVNGFYTVSFVMNGQHAKTVNVKVLQNLNCSEYFLNGNKSTLSEVRNAVLKVEQDKK